MSTPTTGYTIGGAASGTVTSPLPVALTIDGVNDYIPIYTNSATATQAINRNTLLNLASGPAGLTDTQTLTNKTLTNPTINAATLSGNFIGTYTLGGTPTFPASVATLTGTQTLTNKTLTSPTINSPTITNATVSSDTITGFTVSNSGSIYGIPVTTGVISGTGVVGTTALVTNAVQGSQIATNAITLGYAQITTNFSTASTTAAQITGLTATVTVPAGGRKVKITAFARDWYTGTAAQIMVVSIWDGTVGSGTQIGGTQITTSGASNTSPMTAIAVVTPAAGSKTYNIGLSTANASESANIEAAANAPAFILVEAI